MTQCMNPDPHEPHPWAIEPNPGEDGPDWFQCDGVRPSAYVSPFKPVGHDGPCHPIKLHGRADADALAADRDMLATDVMRRVLHLTFEQLLHTSAFLDDLLSPEPPCPICQDTGTITCGLAECSGNPSCGQPCQCFKSVQARSFP